MTSKRRISGYTTTKDAIQMNYPFEECIKNMLSFCDEVVVGDSSNHGDGTLDRLQDLMDEYDHLKVYHVDLDWNASNHGIYDGMMKAYARSKCQYEFCWQQDMDEFTNGPNGSDIRENIDQIIKNNHGLDTSKDASFPLIALPIIEFWGSNGKIRIDVNPWKWRLSRNVDYITHGIPFQLRKYENGLLYAKGGDGCDYINKQTGEIIPCGNFITNDVDQVRQKAIHDSEAAEQYRKWLEQAIQTLPTVYHFSWWSIKEKIKKYQKFWNSSWKALYNQHRDPTYNPFFDKSLDDVTEDEIADKAEELEQKCGGWIFHTPWNGQHTNHLNLSEIDGCEIPTIVLPWCNENLNDRDPWLDQDLNDEEKEAIERAENEGMMYEW